MSTKSLHEIPHNEEENYDLVLKEVGNRGPFQKRFNIIFNFFLVIAATLPYSNLLQVLNVPEHWCHVPGRENTNYSLEEWKNLTVPYEPDTRGRNSPSKCKMYNGSYLEDVGETVECQHGWEYDRTWFVETAPSQEDWVCDRARIVKNTHSVSKVGDVLGTLIFGQLGDIIGRRPVFYMTLPLLMIGRILGAFTAQYWPVFMFANLLSTFASTPVFQSPLLIATETSAESSHAHIAMLQSIGWSLGMSILPLFCWWLGDWVHIMVATTLPCLIFFLPNNLLIESPRWLASRGKTDRAIEQLKIIARANGTSVPEDAKALLSAHGEKEKLYGVMSLFTGWRLTKNTVMISINWTTVILTYNIIVLNVANLGGNPFLDYFCQAIAELPAYLLARYCCDRFGRRLTQIAAYIASAFACIGLAIVIIDPSQHHLILVLAVFMQFSTSISFYGCNLIALEIFPTCIRQSGFAVCCILSTLLGIAGPQIVYLGTEYNARYPYFVVEALMIIGGLAAFFLPETLHQKLPDTLASAHKFGKDQAYFSLPKKPKKENTLLKEDLF